MVRHHSGRDAGQGQPDVRDLHRSPLDLRRGERVRPHFEKRLDEATIVHWHVLVVPKGAAGHPRLAEASGSSNTDEFTVRNPAATSPYHPHLHGRSGWQVYGGLFGVLLIRDTEDDASGLPREPNEPLFVTQKGRFDVEYQRMYVNGMMDRMNGLLGTRCWSTVDRTSDSVSRGGRIASAS